MNRTVDWVKQTMDFMLGARRETKIDGLVLEGRKRGCYVECAGAAQPPGG